jgi:hypothetical protein
MNNILTASRMVTLLQCPRRHYFAYEIGLRRNYDGPALKFGSAWAKAMEARWNDKNYNLALSFALENSELDEYQSSILAALFAAYYKIYRGQKETIKKIYPEEEFSFPLGYGDFTVAGKLDGIGVLKDKRQVIIEHKTTADSIAPDADYWMRLKFNLQLLQYFDAAQKNGWQIESVIYDVVRKPAIRPKQIGKKEDKHVETIQEFSDRLLADCLERPEFYFVRREVAVMENDLKMFKDQRTALAWQINSFRELQKDGEFEGAYHQDAWPRNVLESTCTYCPFKCFCLQNLEIDINHPPDGFSIGKINPELTVTAQDDSTME